jgi:hypothetical protein
MPKKPDTFEMYTWISLSSTADLVQLEKHISAEYDPTSVAKKLADGMSNAVKGVLIERSYIDKDYRSTYYNFYAKKAQRYRPDCVRLHFFDGTVSFDGTGLRLKLSGDGALTYHYFGYMVLRPTGTATIGRSVLSPDVRSGATGRVIAADHKVHLLGYTLTVQGFPSMDQHRDISVCAHSACWSILRHYSERYNVYREFLTHDITLMAQEFNPGGLAPSKGLEISHAERVFQQAGAFPFHVARDMNNPDDLSFYRQLGAYIESGFPLFAAMHDREHAIAVVGYEWRPPVNTGVPGMRYAWDETKAIAVVDDHYLPYLSIPIAGGTVYSAEDIDAFIVALPEKVFYPADAVDRLAPTLFKLGVAGLPPEDETIIRYFMTTAAGLRRFMRQRESEFDPKLLEMVMKLPLAQFVWIVEFATEPQWAMGQIAARAVIDATAFVGERWPLWLFHSRTEALVLNRQSVSLDLQSGIAELRLSNMSNTAFSRMDQNLRPTQPK